MFLLSFGFHWCLSWLLSLLKMPRYRPKWQSAPRNARWSRMWTSALREGRLEVLKFAPSIPIAKTSNRLNFSDIGSILFASFINLDRKTWTKRLYAATNRPFKLKRSFLSSYLIREWRIRTIRVCCFYFNWRKCIV